MISTTFEIPFAICRPTSMTSTTGTLGRILFRVVAHSHFRPPVLLLMPGFLLLLFLRHQLLLNTLISRRLTPFVDDKGGELFDGVIMGASLYAFMFYLLYLDLDMYSFLWTYDVFVCYCFVCLCVFGFWSWHEPLSLYGHIYFWYGSYLYFLYMVYVFGFLFPVDPTVYHLFGGWRYFWMDGGNHLCIHFHIVVFLLCDDGWHIILTVIFFIYAFIVHLALLCLILIYACVKGELHLKCLPKIFVITPYVLSSSKRGRLLVKGH